MLSYFFKTYLICSTVTVLASVLQEKVDCLGNEFCTEKSDVRIAGGEESTDNFAFAFQVQLFINGDEFCSGFIMNKYHFVTAAHCVDNVTTDDIFAMVGSPTFLTGDYMEIEEIVLHPDYNFPQYDIAYMRTVDPVEFHGGEDSNTKSRAHLRPPGTELPREVTVAGWGDQGGGEAFSDNIMYVKLSIIHQMRCQVMYPEVMITKNMICAENTRDGDQGACRGDGGAPATTSYNDIIGISSFTRGCGLGMGPSVFTNLGAREIYEFIVEGTAIDDDDDYIL